MTTVGAIQGWLSQVQATMANLPTALAAAAPTGNFAAVLSSAVSVLEGGAPGAATTQAPTPATLARAYTPALATTTGVPLAGGAPTGSSVVAEAEQFLGTPYVWGGATPAGFDCSGLVQYVYGRLGVSLPRTSEQQAQIGTPVANLASAQPGDLVFYAGADGTPSAPGHVGIYLGNGQIIDAPHGGSVVRIDAVGTPVAIRRVLPPPGPPAFSPVASGLAGSSNPTGTTGAASTAAGSDLGALAPLFLQAAARWNVPAPLLRAVAQVESNLTPGAVSSAGAEGLMQLLPSTAASLGIDPFDPAQAIDGAAQLLGGYLRQYGSVEKALAAYNAGPAAVAQYGGVPPYPQTQAYVQAVLQRLGAAGTPVPGAAVPGAAVPGAAPTTVQPLPTTLSGRSSAAPAVGAPAGSTTGSVS